MGRKIPTPPKEKEGENLELKRLFLTLHRNSSRSNSVTSNRGIRREVEIIVSETKKIRINVLKIVGPK